MTTKQEILDLFCKAQKCPLPIGCVGCPDREEACTDAESEEMCNETLNQAKFEGIETIKEEV